MSINVDKMDAKPDDSLHKQKAVLKRRKKNASNSELSSDSLSPKKNIPNGFAEYYRSSPETIDSPRHSIYANPLEGSSHTGPLTNGSMHMKTPENAADTFSQNGSARLVESESESPRHSTSTNNHYDDSDSASSMNMGPSRRQPRTPEDFYLFCQFILEYANYNEMCNQDALRNSTHSPLDSTGSATESTTSSANDESNHATIDTIKDEMDGKDLDGSSVILNETNPEDVTKASAIDVSSTNEFEDDDSDIDADSYNLITCYCGKPYAARPMIECSQCLTWLHLSCAKIKRKNIPDVFICVKCSKPNGQQQQQQQQQTMSTHPKDHQSNEPKENNRSKKSNASNTSQLRSDKLENNILQPLNVSAAYETGANNIDNIKTTSTVSSISVKYK